MTRLDKKKIEAATQKTLDDDEETIEARERRYARDYNVQALAAMLVEIEVANDKLHHELSRLAVKKNKTLDEKFSETETLRDRFAMAALPGILTDRSEWDAYQIDTRATSWADWVARRAFIHADAMMKRRKVK